ncbi:hypothetical protein [Streptomyces yangpuensis]|uniref:hypothetical protein n=1 Tax=Streptomyces yangpuensis TaxID=1648182 RepID=UPI0036816D9E
MRAELLHSTEPEVSAKSGLAAEEQRVRRSIVAERVAWFEASLPRDAAAERIALGRADRYLIADLDHQEQAGGAHHGATAAAR